MTPNRLHRLSALIALAAALAGAALSPDGAHAAEQSARLTLTLELERQAPTQLGAEAGRMTLKQRVEYAITLASDGERLAINPLDPAEPARLRTQSQRAEQRVREGLAAQAARDARGPAHPAAPTMDPQALQAMAQRLQARCGSDRDCLMREASAFSAAQVAAQAGPGGDAAVASKLQAYGAAWRDCERRHPTGPLRDACINRARVAAGGTADEPDEPEAPTPYLLFRALAACQPAGVLSLDERIDGQFADVQGQVAYRQTRQADDRRAVAATPCGTQMAVLDTRNGRLWVHQPVLGLQAQGVAERREAGRSPQRSEGAQELRWHEATPWLHERLTRLDRQGSAQAVLPAGAGGQTRVRLDWRWQPL